MHQDEYVKMLDADEAFLEYSYSQVLNSLQGMIMYVKDELFPKSWCFCLETSFFLINLADCYTWLINYHILNLHQKISWNHQNMEYLGQDFSGLEKDLNSVKLVNVYSFSWLVDYN